MATITMFNSINVDDAFSPLFFAVATGATSGSSTTDTTSTWTARTLPSSSAWNSICYGNKQIVMVAGGSSTVAASTVGAVNPTARTLPVSANWQSVCFGNNTFVAVANGSTNTAVSTYGTSWTSGGALPSSDQWYCATYGLISTTPTFVVVATNSTTAAAYSTDNGVNWSSSTLPSTGNWRSVCFGNGRFVAINYGGTNTAISTNGTSWSAGGSLPTSRNWSSIAWGNPGNTANGVFVAVAYGSAIGAISTNNGTSWTEVYLAPEMVVNGSFTGSADGWTLGSGWSYSNNSISHTSGTATVVPSPTLSVTAAYLYQVTYTVSNCTTGTIQVAIGGTSGTLRSGDGTYAEVITASGTGNLTFTPSTGFNGTIDDISVRQAGNWNCISYGESSAQGVKVFTVTGYANTYTTVSFTGSDWFLKTISSAANWNYHCFAPITWNSGDTLSVQNDATITVNTNQTKFWKTFTATYGKLSIQNNSTSAPINFYMGRVSSNTANDITPLSGAFSIDIDGNWIEIGTGDGTASQTMTASFSEYIPSVWVETGAGTGVYEIWNNISGASGPYMKMFGRTGLEWVGTGKRGNYFVQTPNSNFFAAHYFTLSSGATTNQSYFVTCTSTTGVLPGATITGTNIPANTVVNRVVDSTTLELNAVATATGTGYTFSIFNPAQSQWTSTLTFGNGVNGNVIPTGAKVRHPNIMFSDATAANLITASHLVGAYINMSNGGIIDVRTCLFGEAYLNLAQAASVYFRNVGFAYQWALSECYSVDMDGVGCAAGPTIWYYSSKWIIRDPRYGVLPPFGYTASTASQNVSLSYIHNAVIKNWHKVTYCTAYFTGTTILMPIDLSYTDDAVFENIRSVSLNATRVVRAFNISNRVYRSSFTNLELYGSAPLQVVTSDNNTFTNIEYALDLTRPIQSFKTGMRLSEDASGTLLTDNVPVYIKTRSFFTWNSRETYFESAEYSATPFQNNWLFPDTLSIRPTESTPASVTFNWTRRGPEAGTLAYEIHRSTSQGFTTRNSTTSVYRDGTAATVTFVNGPRTTVTAAATTNILTFTASNKRCTSSGTSATNFTTTGHAVGDVVVVSGTANNDGVYTVITVNAAYLAFMETVINETCTTGQTITGRTPIVDTKYYYRMRKFHSLNAFLNCQGSNGTSTITTSGTAGGVDFTNLYSATDFYYDSGTTIIRNRKYNLFAIPFYLGSVITGPGIPAGTTITYIDAAGQKYNISQATTSSASCATLSMPVQAGMAVTHAPSRPGSGIDHGTTVVSVDSSTSLTISNALTADLCPTVVNGSFTGNSTGWTLTAGWSYSNDSISHTSGTTTVTQTSALTAVIGRIYTIKYKITNCTAGTITASFGGASGTARNVNGIFTETVTATSTGNLTFTPDTSFNGTLDDVELGVPLYFQPFTESPELVCTPHDYSSVRNYCLQSRTLATTWTPSGITATNANTYQAPSDVTWATPATSTSLTSTTSPGTLTQSISGLSIGNVYSASIWVRAEQTIALPNGVSGSLQWGTVTTPFTATYEWKKINAYNFTATATSHNIIITITTSGQTIWVADVMVTDGTSTTATVTTTTTATTLKPCAIPITTLYSYARSSDMVGSTGHQGIHVTFGTAPTGSYYHEVYLSTTSGFTPSDDNLVARTWALSDAVPFPITGSNNNNFKSITKLPYGGSSTAATTGIFYLTGNSNNNAFVDVDIDYVYCNTTAIPALHLISPSQNNVFHNLNFGRVANYLAASTLWHSTAVNSVTGNRIQNLYTKHYDYLLNDQSLNSKFKGVASANSFPAATSTTYTFGSGIDDLVLIVTACYGSMFKELYFSSTKGSLVIVMEDTQGIKPYTTTGSPRFSNTGRLYMPTVNDSITITWPWKIKGVTAFRDVMPRLSGLDYGNNNIFLDSLKLEYKLNEGAWTILTANNLVNEGSLDATNGFDFAVRITPQYFMKFSTQTTGTYSYHNPTTDYVYITGNPTWATGQKVMYTTTGSALGGLINCTEYYLLNVTNGTTGYFQLSLTQGGSAIDLSTDVGSGVHTFNVNFQVGETVMGALSFATAVVTEVYYDTINTGTIVVNNITGSWVAGEFIKTPDNKAVKALNVATNNFALGPQYSSYISGLQIGTWVDQTKKYDAAIVTVTLTNIVPGSSYYIYRNDNSEQIATGTATGTPVFGQTTIDYNVSVVYEENFEITVNVRKSSGPIKYLPYETGSTVTSRGAYVFIAQVADTVVLDSYGSIASDWTINLTPYETIKHSSGTAVYTVKQLYSYLQDYFDELGYLDDQIPMSTSTPTEYNLINGWFIDNESFKYLTGGSITTSDQNGEIYLLNFDSIGYTSAVAEDLGKLVHNSGSTHTGYLVDFDNTNRKWWVKKTLGTFTTEALTIASGTGAGTATSVVTGESTWTNIFTLGSLVPSTTLDVYQNDIQITPWWPENSGHIDILVKVEESGTAIDDSNLTILARTYGSLYDHFIINAPSGRNPVPLASFSDGNNQTSIGTVAAYTGFTFTFGATFKNLNNGSGPRPYDCVVECNNHTVSEIYEYLKYITRSGSTTIINGVEGEFYISVGDIRFAYDNEAVGTFVEGELITGTGDARGYLVSLTDNGTSGFMVLRNVHGTFSNNMPLLGATNGATAQVDGSVTQITSQKQAPFGTLAGGQFFGARGIWLDHVNSADINNFQLIDSLGITQIPPSFISVTVSGLEEGDMVSVFRTTGNNKIIDKTYLHSHSSNNLSSSTSWEVDPSTPISNDTPAEGIIRLVKSSTKVEERIAYTSWTGNIFTLSSAHSGGYDGSDTAYVPYIDTITNSTFESVSFSYVTDRTIYTVVRHKGIIPFDVKGTITTTGYSLTAIRTVDSIVG